jgi:hypothetical protein
MTRKSRIGCGPLLMAAGLALVPATSFAQQGACPGARIPLDISVGSSPFVRMQIAGHEGMFALETGPNVSGSSISVVDRQTFGLPANSDKMLSLTGGSLPTLDRMNVLPADLSGLVGPGGRPAGVIASDHLSHRIVELRYDMQQPFVVISAEPCPEQRLKQAGFVPIAQQGYYTAPASLNMGTLDAPVIYLRIGSVSVPARISSSKSFLDNSKLDVIDINDALLQQLRHAGVDLQSAGTLATKDCSGKLVDQPMWIAGGSPLSYTTADGQVLFTFGPPRLRLLSGTCLLGTQPFAMVGAVAMLRLGALVLDGRNGMVWVKPSRSETSAQPPYDALALSWNASGGWTVSEQPDVEQAKSDALTRCNRDNGGNCSLALSADSWSFACVAVASNPRKPSNLSAASNASYAEARSSVLGTCNQQYGASCKLERLTCND